MSSACSASAPTFVSKVTPVNPVPAMLKRPLHAQFGPKVLAGIKRTTIRSKPWPLGKPIMLYHWTGKPYRSPQQDVAAVEAVFTCPITITHIRDKSGSPWVHFGMALADFEKLPCDSMNLWQLEGFDSHSDMVAWFLAKLKPGQTLQKHLMLFNLLPTKN